MNHSISELFSTPERPFQGSAPQASKDVGAAVNYLIPPLGRNAVYVVPLGGGAARRTAEYAPTPVEVRDARSAGLTTLDRNGFFLDRQVSAVTDFNDDDEVRAVYYPEMEALLRARTGASSVVVFDHNVRMDGGLARSNSRVPVRIVHNDYTEKSGPQRVRALLGEARAAALLQRRFAIVNVWRSIAGTVLTAPLGVIDAGSVRSSDLVPTDLVYPDRIGEIYEVAGNPAHRWYYFSNMNEQEVLLIKGYDSRTDVARFTPHSAFDHPDAPVGAPPRRSIEVRSLVFF